MYLLFLVIILNYLVVYKVLNIVTGTLDYGCLAKGVLPMSAFWI